MRLQIAVLLAVCTTASAIKADGESNQPAVVDAGWGAVSGQVVFAGDPDDDLLEPYRRDINLYDPISIQDSSRGVQPRVRETVRNDCLLIDAKSRGVGNVVLYLRKNPGRVYPGLIDKPLPAVELTCKDHLFTPRIVLLQAGQRLRMGVDPDANAAVNFKTQFAKNPNFNRVAHSAKPAIEYTPERAEKFPVRIESNLERAALAWCLVLDHPYAAVSAKDGSFSIENIPTGDHELVVWHETVGYLGKPLPIVIQAGQTCEVEPSKLTLAKLWQADRRRAQAAR